MKFQITTTVDVDGCEKSIREVVQTHGFDKVKASVAAAVADALSHFQGEGFRHDLADEISIVADSEVSANLLL